MCEDMCTPRSTLNTHLRVHSRDRPSFCKSCEERFTRRLDRNTRLKLQIGGYFVYKVCMKMCTKWDSLSLQRVWNLQLYEYMFILTEQWSVRYSILFHRVLWLQNPESHPYAYTVYGQFHKVCVLTTLSLRLVILYCLHFEILILLEEHSHINILCALP
jgi:hypothetical protein